MVNWINVTDMTTTSTTAKSSSSDSWDSQATIDDATSSGIAEIIFRPNTGAINQHWLCGLNSGTVSSGHDCDYQFRGSGSSGTNLYDVYVPTNSRVLANQSYTFGDWFKITYDFSTGTVTWYKSADVSPKVWTTIYTLTGQTKTSILASLLVMHLMQAFRMLVVPLLLLLPFCFLLLILRLFSNASLVCFYSKVGSRCYWWSCYGSRLYYWCLHWLWYFKHR